MCITHQFNSPMNLTFKEHQSSINEMVSKGRVIVNCTGPYRLLGERVLSACAKRNAHNKNILFIIYE